MITSLKRVTLALALTATGLTAAATSAEARDRYYGDRRGGNDAAIAIGAGLVGLAIGAAIADRGDDRYYDRRYYPSRRYVSVRGYPGYYYYYQGNPNRYYRDRYYDRYYRPYYQSRYNRYDRGYDRASRYYGRDRYYDRDRRYDRDDNRRGRYYRGY